MVFQNMRQCSDKIFVGRLIRCYSVVCTIHLGVFNGFDVDAAQVIDMYPRHILSPTANCRTYAELCWNQHFGQYASLF